MSVIAGLSLPRISRRGRQLPSGREVTNIVLNRQENPDEDFTAMLISFGQFLDHDLDHVPIHRCE